ncbi:hypothetical protein AGMMS50284_3610 [Clostridia bacterium]|nr:hypothetical protein AGMMS50284_3610 [Clostridia bacterium]
MRVIYEEPKIVITTFAIENLLLESGGTGPTGPGGNEQIEPPTVPVWGGDDEDL